MQTNSQSSPAHIIELKNKSEIFFATLSEKVRRDPPKALIAECKKLTTGQASNEFHDVIVPIIRGKIKTEHAAKILLSREEQLNQSSFLGNELKAQLTKYEKFLTSLELTYSAHGEKIFTTKANQEMAEV